MVIDCFEIVSKLENSFAFKIEKIFFFEGIYLEGISLINKTKLIVLRAKIETSFFSKNFIFIDPKLDLDD